MRFSLSLLLSMVLHVIFVVGIYLFNSHYKPTLKPQTISFAIDSFSFEQSKPIVKPMVKKEKIIEKPKVEKIKQVVDKKPIVKPIVKKKSIIKKKPIKKPKPKVVKKPKLKVKPVKKEIPQKVVVKKEVKQEVKKIVKEEAKEIAVETKEKIIQKSVQAPTKKANLPPKSTQVQKLISDFEVQAFLKKIYYIIYQHKSYPLRAKKLRIQGEAIAKFTLFSDGSISKIEIVKSSGVKFLDAHALETIIDASESFPKPPSKMEMKIPIRYSLKDN